MEIQDKDQAVEILEPEFSETIKIAEKETELFDRLFLPSLLSASWLPRQGSKVEKHERAYGSLSIIVSCGHRRGLEPLYLPTGLIPRRVLVALTTKAVQTQSRFVDCSSISELLSEMNLSINGVQIKRIQKQLIQLSRSRIEIVFKWRDYRTGKDQEVFYDGSIFKKLSVNVEPSKQGRMIPNVIEFDETFFNKVLKNHSVPYSKELYNCSSSLSHDVFLWLQRRDYDLGGERLALSYEQMASQFASGKTQAGRFRQRFKEAVKEVSGLLNLDVSLERKQIVLNSGKSKQHKLIS
jgi:hypothetical protein|tara:strand:+ start:727 stop:1611 length:885 start_codon:yes stop_codon:yes gene_type:complete